MKLISNTRLSVRYVFLVFMFSVFSIPRIQAQQSNTLFFMHSLPQSGFVNPAVQTSCGLYIGLPMVSSVHANIASNGFNVMQSINRDSTNNYSLNLNFNEGNIQAVNYVLSEAHIVLLALGYRFNDYYFSFTITEKNNQAALYTDDLATYYRLNNKFFESQWMNLNPSSILSNHFREYAIGASKSFSNGLKLGLKTKILFGKMNIESSHSQAYLYTQENSNDILFDMNLNVNSSMPYSIHLEGEEEYRFYNRYNNSSGGILMNRKNPGFAIDFGFIYDLNEHISFSGSIIDLGFISYKSNLTNYSLKGHYFYEGDWGSYPALDSLVWDVFDELNHNMSSEITHDSYFSFLDPRLYLGASYLIDRAFQFNFLLYNRFFTNHIQTGGTVSLQYKPARTLNTCISWSYMNNSISNFGLGIDYRVDPIQVYLVSDNILGVIMPNTFNAANIRFGFNLHFGCNTNPGIKNGWGLKNRMEYRKLRKNKNRYTD